jgi:hypothetical protein
MPAPSLVAQHHLDDGFGSALRDSSGNANDGAINGQDVQWVARRKGYCLEFNGIDSYVDCGSGAPFGFADAVMVEAWVLPEAKPPTEAAILGKGYESYFLSFYSDGFWCWYSNQSGQAGVGNYAKAELVITHHAGGLDTSASRSGTPCRDAVPAPAGLPALCRRRIRTTSNRQPTTAAPNGIGVSFSSRRIQAEFQARAV